jgi:hypothetical protein
LAGHAVQAEILPVQFPFAGEFIDDLADFDIA